MSLYVSNRKLGAPCCAPLLPIVALLLSMASPSLAQVREEVTVEVVDVPVYVFANGEPIRNLTKDDFTLFVNGKRQSIDYFDVVDYSAAGKTSEAATPELQRDIRERRLFLLVFDAAYSRPAAMDRARRAALRMVDGALPSDLFAVVLYNSTGAKFLIPFSRDRSVIRRALLQLSPSGSRDALAISITPSERQAMAAYVPLGPDDAAAAGQGTSIATIGKEGENPIFDIIATGHEEEVSRAKHLAESQLDDLAAIAGRLARLDGDKHVILFSSGFTSDFFHGPLPKPGEMGQVPLVDPQMFHGLKSMAEMFQAAGALLHTVDTGDLRIGETGAIGGETMLMFASRTGGQYIHGSNDFAGELARLSATLSAEYRLGFKPTGARKGANTIDVKVKNLPAGATLSFRKGFSTVVAPAKTTDALLLADIIQNDVAQSGVPPSFAFTERPFLDVIVPARQLTKQFGAINDADVLLYIFDTSGAAVDYREKKLSFPPDAQRDAAIREKLTLPPGHYVAKAVLRVGTSLGFAKVAFTIPEG